MQADVVTWRILHYCVRVTDSVLRADDPVRQSIPDLLEWVERQISSTRNRNDADPEESVSNDRIDTKEAADIMGVSRRRVQQKIKNGDLRAETIGRTYFLNRRDIG